MEIEGLKCNGCGSTDVSFDPVTRRVHCNQCGREEYYSRARLGASGHVAFTKDNAVKFFKEGKRAESVQFATDVLNMMLDNETARFILAYYAEFASGKTGAMKKFFQQSEDTALEYDEVRDLIDLFEHCLYNMRDFEAEMLTLLVKNMQSQDDRPELEKFIDTVCPYCIEKYPSEDFLTDSRVELYCDLASHCRIPKTCLALLKGIRENPDSPYRTNGFFLKTKTAYFRDHYIAGVGQIISSMMESPYKAKFIMAFQKEANQYDQDSMTS